MKVSIVVPVHNEEKTIERCLRSLIGELPGQIEVIVVNDGSTDATRRIAEHFAFETKCVKVINTDHVGGCKAFNMGVEAATGEYIGSLGGDDAYLPGKVAEQVAYLDAHPEVGMVFGWPSFMDEAGNDWTDEAHPYMAEVYRHPVNRTRAEWLEFLTLTGNCLFGPTALYRKSLHDQHGLYDERLRILNDLEFYIRCIETTEFHVMDKPLARVCIRNQLAGISAPNDENLRIQKQEWKIIGAKRLKSAGAKMNYQGKVIISTPTRTGEAYAAYISSLTATIAAFERLGIQYDYWPLDGDSYVDRARNTICARFLQSDATDLIFIDSDEGWDVVGVLRLLMHQDEIVGGNYRIKNAWEHWGAVPLVDGDGTPLGKMLPNGNALIEARFLPAGFMRIKKTALERFIAHYPDRYYFDNSADPQAPDQQYYAFFHCIYDFENHARYGEDTGFCKQWRDMGGQLWIEPNMEIAHYGTKEWRGNYDQYLRANKHQEVAA